MSKSASRLSQIPFNREFFKNKKDLELLCGSHFNFFSFVIYKLAKFYHQTLLTSEVIKENAFACISPIFDDSTKFLTL